tara:strand:- start:442 stop:624 length:183 start_codon:yes stop_codon:yes gene_type:complete
MQLQLEQEVLELLQLHNLVQIQFLVQYHQKVVVEELHIIKVMLELQVDLVVEELFNKEQE